MFRVQFAEIEQVLCRVEAADPPCSKAWNIRIWGEASRASRPPSATIFPSPAIRSTLLLSWSLLETIPFVAPDITPRLRYNALAGVLLEPLLPATPPPALEAPPDVTRSHHQRLEHNRSVGAGTCVYS